ncbi:hypothetical protein [Dyella nitratireducens]|uniref:Chitin-binding type-3 domain-containing protein n=1 Tax=Dyella nitratireducens TaxID=1849580 RepID=A0ABQ1FN30_9GAMM|nr:hypothetical protein [Dyella nitratireducens]GGA23345.1 hypothetical protein GCM10010981_09580 [Dyella nitratireducens]GLQ43980.1 hypothetical protein GCM10007902_38300 [Dyella nitratireducens]
MYPTEPPPKPTDPYPINPSRPRPPHTTTSAPEFTNGKRYEKGEQVTHNGSTYEAQFNVKDVTPGSESDDGDWKLVSAPAFDSKQRYEKGQQVTYNGNIYEAQDNIKGVAPDEPDQTDWKPMSGNNQAQSNTQNQNDEVST